MSEAVGRGGVCLIYEARTDAIIMWFIGVIITQVIRSQRKSNDNGCYEQIKATTSNTVESHWLLWKARLYRFYIFYTTAVTVSLIFSKKIFNVVINKRKVPKVFFWVKCRANTILLLFGKLCFYNVFSPACLNSVLPPIIIWDYIESVCDLKCFRTSLNIKLIIKLNVC